MEITERSQSLDHVCAVDGTYGEMASSTSSWIAEATPASGATGRFAGYRDMLALFTDFRFFTCKFVVVNLISLLLTVFSGIILYEFTVEALRDRVGKSVIFPVYVPRAVGLAAAALFGPSVAISNFLSFFIIQFLYAVASSFDLSCERVFILLAMSILSMLEVQGCGLVMRRCFSGDEATKGTRMPVIDSTSNAFKFVASVLVFTVVFETLTAVLQCASGLVQWSDFARYWGTWWFGVVAAMLSVTPFLIHVYAAADPQPLTLALTYRLLQWVCVHWKPVIQFFAFHAVSVGMQILIFCFLTTPVIRPLPYLVFPFLVAGVFLQTRWGWTLVVVSNALICSWATLNKRGAFYEMAGRYEQQSPKLIIQIELYVAVVALVGLFLAAAVAETQQLTRKLSGYNQVLEQEVEERTKAVQHKVKELEASQARAEKASHAKSDFLANMSHEIRTPIHGILGMTGLLLESTLNADQRDNLLSLKECADLLLHIINSILDLAKIEAGRLEVECVGFSIRRMVTSTMRMLLPRAQSCGLKLLWIVDVDVPDLCRGDPGKIQQCLLNLVGNALKFTQQGSVTVRVSLKDSVHRAQGADRVGSPTKPLPKLRSWSSWPGPSFKVEPVEESLSLSATDVAKHQFKHAAETHYKIIPSATKTRHERAQLLFEVRDTGIGISSEKLQDIFSPFTQADASTSRLYGGTGLGLCIVQRFCELLGGKVWAESQLGCGSVFHFAIPLSVVTEGDEDSAGESVSETDSFRHQSFSGSSTLPSPHGAQGIHDFELLELDSSTTLVQEPSVQSQGTALEAESSRAWDQQQDMHIGKSWMRTFFPSFLERTMSDPGIMEGIAKCRIPPALKLFSLATITARGAQADEVSGGITDFQPTRSGNQRAGCRRHFDGSAHRFLSPSRQVHASNLGIEKGLRDASSCRRMDSIPELRQLASPSGDQSKAPQQGSSVAEFDMEAQQGAEYRCETPGQMTHEGRAGVLDLSNSSVGGVACVVPRNVLAGSCSSSQMETDSYRRGELAHRDMEQQKDRDAGLVHSSLKAPASTGRRPKKQLKVLLAEDNVINQKVACRLLQRHGHAVTVVEDGLQALNFVRENHAVLDLIVMDVQMPKMDGLEATRRIREEEEALGWSRLPILGSTAHAIQGYQDVCFSSGMDGYLGKPFNSNELTAAVARVMHGTILDHG